MHLHPHGTILFFLVCHILSAISIYFIQDEIVFIKFYLAMFSFVSLLISYFCAKYTCTVKFSQRIILRFSKYYLFAFFIIVSFNISFKKLVLHDYVIGIVFVFIDFFRLALLENIKSAYSKSMLCVFRDGLLYFEHCINNYKRNKKEDKSFKEKTTEELFDFFRKHVNEEAPTVDEMFLHLAIKESEKKLTVEKPRFSSSLANNLKTTQLSNRKRTKSENEMLLFANLLDNSGDSFSTTNNTELSQKNFYSNVKNVSNDNKNKDLKVKIERHNNSIFGLNDKNVSEGRNELVTLKSNEKICLNDEKLKKSYAGQTNEPNQLRGSDPDIVNRFRNSLREHLANTNVANSDNNEINIGGNNNLINQNIDDSEDWPQQPDTEESDNSDTYPSFYITKFGLESKFGTMMSGKILNVLVYHRENRKINFFRFCEIYKQILRERKMLYKAIEGSEKLMSTFYNLILLIQFAIYVMTLDFFYVSTQSYLTYALPFFLFVLFPSIKEVIESFCFLIYNHPFDCGDRVYIDGHNMLVTEINVYCTIFEKWSGQMNIISNKMLWNKRIENIRRSGSQKLIETITFNKKYFDRFDSVKRHLKEFVMKEGSYKSIYFYMEKELKSDYITYKVVLTIRINFQSGYFMWRARTKFERKLRRLLYQNGVKLIIMARKYDIEGLDRFIEQNAGR